MRGLFVVGAATAAILATAGAAAAGNSDKPAPPGQAQTPPGQEQTPPGQAKRAETQPDKAIPPGQQDIPAGQEAPSGVEAEGGNAAPPAARAPRTEHAQPETAPPHHAKHAKQAQAPPRKETVVQSHGNSAVAHTHVIICHRTGSLSHPYVVINISMSAWLEGHTTHPALNGHADILLKQGATPGEKLPLSACHGAATPTTSTPPARTSTSVQRSTRARESDPADPRPSKPPVLPSTRVVGTATPAEAERFGAAAEASRMEASAQLPFTGTPLWVAALAGFWLIGTGLALRKSCCEPARASAPAASSSPSRRSGSARGS